MNYPTACATKCYFYSMDENFGTLSETNNALIKLGYTHDFNIQGDCLVCHESTEKLSPADFQIDKVYRFEGETNPDDEAILYAISSTKYNMKGTLVNGYGISADADTAKLIDLLQTNQPHIDVPFTANEATPQRPDGDRVINAPLVQMNLAEFINQIKSESTWAESDRNSITIFKSDTMRIVMIGLHKNAAMKPHKANGVISVQVLEGNIHFEAAQRNTDLVAGQMIALQANVTHSVKAMDDSIFLLTLAMNSK